MSKKKDQLGKGLRALLTKIDSKEATPKQKEKAIAQLTNTVNEINIKAIEANPFQPRSEFKESELLELVQSIKNHGLIQPITVRSIGGEKYQIISGERRWRASKLAGLKTVPVYIRVADDQGMLELALVENIQRSNLNALEIAISYQRLIDECSFQHDELALRVGKERSTVTNYIRLLKLPPDIQTALKSNKISMGHARALLSLDDTAKQIHLYKRIVADGLSVRQTETEIRSSKNKKRGIKPAPKRPVHPEVLKIKQRLINHFSTKVDIQRSNKGKGKLVIHFDSDDQFNDIIELIED